MWFWGAMTKGRWSQPGKRWWWGPDSKAVLINMEDLRLEKLIGTAWWLIGRVDFVGIFSQCFWFPTPTLQRWLGKRIWSRGRLVLLCTELLNSWEEMLRTRDEKLEETSLEIVKNRMNTSAQDGWGTELPWGRWMVRWPLGFFPLWKFSSLE